MSKAIQRYEEEDTCHMRRRIHVKGDLESTHRSSGISLLDKVPQHWFFSKKWVAQYIQHIKAWPSIFIFSQKWVAQYIQHIKAIQRAIIRSQPARQCAARIFKRQEPIMQVPITEKHGLVQLCSGLVQTRPTVTCAKPGRRYLSQNMVQFSCVVAQFRNVRTLECI